MIGATGLPERSATAGSGVRMVRSEHTTAIGCNGNPEVLRREPKAPGFSEIGNVPAGYDRRLQRLAGSGIPYNWRCPSRGSRMTFFAICAGPATNFFCLDGLRCRHRLGGQREIDARHGFACRHGDRRDFGTLETGGRHFDAVVARVERT